MSTESNKTLMDRFRDFINTADSDTANELISADASFYVPGLHWGFTVGSSSSLTAMIQNG